VKNKKLLLLLFFVALKLALQYISINPAYELHRDEYLHLDQANHLAWGYLSVPPLTSWIALLIKLLGNGVFWVKFFPALFGATTLVVMWYTIEELRGGIYAQILAAIAFIFSATLRINTLFQPNSFEILSWTLLFFFLVKFISTQNNKWLYWLGTFAGISFLNKYNLLFMLMGLLPAVLLTAQRKLFLNKHFYFAILLGLLIILPNILWQINNSWPVVNHLKELSDTQLVNVKRSAFLIEQALFFLGAEYLVLGALIAFIFYKPFKPYRLIGLGFVFTIAIYTYFKAKGYYAIGLYPVLLCFGAVYWERLFAMGWKKYTRILWPVITMGLFILVMRLVLPMLSPEQVVAKEAKFKKLGLLRWEDGKDHALPQDFADMLGWKEMTEKTIKAYELIPVSERKNTLILCDNYGEAGAINFYSRGKLPAAASFSADYLTWFPQLDSVKNLISVAIDTDSAWQKNFGAPIYSDSISNKFAREYQKRIFVLPVVDPGFTEKLTAYIKQRRKESMSSK